MLFGDFEVIVRKEGHAGQGPAPVDVKSRDFSIRLYPQFDHKCASKRVMGLRIWYVWHEINLGNMLIMQKMVGYIAK